MATAPRGTFIAADYATKATYAGGWSAGQNGGYGFGAWSFNGRHCDEFRMPWNPSRATNKR